jgi:hypothetical protein
MGGVGEVKNTCNSFVGNTEGVKPVGGLRPRSVGKYVEVDLDSTT